MDPSFPMAVYGLFLVAKIPIRNSLIIILPAVLIHFGIFFLVVKEFPWPKDLDKYYLFEKIKQNYYVYWASLALQVALAPLYGLRRDLISRKNFSFIAQGLKFPDSNRPVFSWRQLPLYIKKKIFLSFDDQEMERKFIDFYNKNVIDEFEVTAMIMGGCAALTTFLSWKNDSQSGYITIFSILYYIVLAFLGVFIVRYSQKYSKRDGISQVTISSFFVLYIAGVFTFWKLNEPREILTAFDSEYCKILNAITCLAITSGARYSTYVFTGFTLTVGMVLCFIFEIMDLDSFILAITIIILIGFPTKFNEKQLRRYVFFETLRQIAVPQVPGQPRQESIIMKTNIVGNDNTNNTA